MRTGLFSTIWALGLTLAAAAAQTVHDRVFVSSAAPASATAARTGPTVVFVPGLGGAVQDWAAVRARLPAAAPVVVLGPAPGRLGQRREWEPEAVAARLQHQLRAAVPPFVLVGHSSGGFQVQAFLAVHPNEAAGAVFVDASHADSVALTPAPM